jgi:hypothetical protein
MALSDITDITQNATLDSRRLQQKHERLHAIIAAQY